MPSPLCRRAFLFYIHEISRLCPYIAVYTAQKSWPVLGCRCNSFLSRILGKLLHRHHINQNTVARISTCAVNQPTTLPTSAQPTGFMSSNKHNTAGCMAAKLNSVSSCCGKSAHELWFYVHALCHALACLDTMMTSESRFPGTVPKFGDLPVV